MGDRIDWRYGYGRPHDGDEDQLPYPPHAHEPRQKKHEETKIITVTKIQQAVTSRYGISHDDLVGQKRSQDIAEARHVAIWLSRNLCDLTLGDIGKNFGGRSHATVKHSIKVVDDWQRENKQLYDRVFHLQRDITEGKSE